MTIFDTKHHKNLRFKRFFKFYDISLFIILWVFVYFLMSKSVVFKVILV